MGIFSLCPAYSVGLWGSCPSLSLGWLNLVLQSHTTERFLLLYGEVILCCVPIDMNVFYFLYGQHFCFSMSDLKWTYSLTHSLEIPTISTWFSLAFGPFVLQSHRHERFLLFVWGAVLFQHVRNEIHTIGKPLARDLSRLVLHLHTHERFLLSYGKAFLFLHVRFHFHIFGKPLAFKPTWFS